MTIVAAILAEVQVEARAVETDTVIELRPLPVWCPLPRGDDDPKVTCVGWVAGRQTARTAGTVTTATWCQIYADTPPELVSNPVQALSSDRLPAETGNLWALSKPRSFDWLSKVLADRRRFRTALDLGAINERRAAMFDSVRWSGQRRSSPTFGRGWWIAEAETGDRVRRDVLGALDDRFVFVERGGGGNVLDSDALVSAVEKAALV
jgi:hypothetical protein